VIFIERLLLWINVKEAAVSFFAGFGILFRTGGWFFEAAMDSVAEFVMAEKQEKAS
jgi:hypothetical protein